MGRLPTGTLRRYSRFMPMMLRPGRRVWIGRGEALAEATVLLCERRRLWIWTAEPSDGTDRPDGLLSYMTAPRRVAIRASVVPRRWRDARGYELVYLGRRHPLANRSGVQYTHRLVAMARARSIHPARCRLPDRRRPETVALS